MISGPSANPLTESAGFMQHFTAHRLEIKATVTSPIALNEHQGSALRGALFHALYDRFCVNKAARECAECALVQACPIATLMATWRPDGERGGNVPRPYTIEPPLNAPYRYQNGDTLRWSITLFADALTLIPYVILGVQALEEEGLGKTLPQSDGRWRRGRLVVEEIAAVHPWKEQRQMLYQRGTRLVATPALPITADDVSERVTILRGDRLHIEFITPTRLIDNKRLVHRPLFRPFFQRLVERLSALSHHFTTIPLPDVKALLATGLDVRVIEDRTRWVELQSYSSRQHRPTPTGGFVGGVSFTGDLDAALPLLVWGEVVHVGKDAVKGNGWYVLRSTVTSK
jgi:hypothetical protein